MTLVLDRCLTENGVFRCGKSRCGMREIGVGCFSDVAKLDAGDVGVQIGESTNGHGLMFGAH